MATGVRVGPQPFPVGATPQVSVSRSASPAQFQLKLILQSRVLFSGRTTSLRERRWFLLKIPRCDTNGVGETEVTVTLELHAQFQVNDCKQQKARPKGVNLKVH